MTNDEKKKCCSVQENCLYRKFGGWSCVGLFFAGISALFIILIALDLTENYESKTCKVIDVIIPKVCPSHSTDNWSRCKCGRKCKSYNPCENLVVVFDNRTDFYDLKEYQISRSAPCTFYDKHCKFEKYDSKIEVANNTYNKYINTTIDCYYSPQNDFVFIGFEYTDHYIILGVVCFTFIGSCICIMCALYYDDN